MCQKVSETLSYCLDSFENRWTSGLPCPAAEDDHPIRAHETLGCSLDGVDRASYTISQPTCTNGK